MMSRVIPPLLEAGATISVVAPAGIVDRERLEQGMACLRALGFGLKTYRDVYAHDAIFAGDDRARAEELMRAFTDPDTQAIFAARGGYGCIRLLPRLDFSQIAAHPKIFVGYSDNTVLHAAFWSKCRLVTFHGPHASDLRRAVDGELSPTTAALWRTLMVDGGHSREKADATWTESLPEARAASAESMFMIAPGAARAPVVGGNLALVCSLLGSDYQIDTHGRILFLEDVDEPPYRIDRYLQQLRLAGCFDHVSGILLGSFTRCAAEDSAWTTAEVFADHFCAASYPVLAGFPAGHDDHNLTFPLGVESLVDATAGVFQVLEEPWLSRGSHGWA